jgi:hypothetical protein
MNAVETVFGVVVLLLAAAAVILALVVVLVWLWGQLRRVLAANRRPTPDELFWQQHAALTSPPRRQ